MMKTKRTSPRFRFTVLDHEKGRTVVWSAGYDRPPDWLLTMLGDCQIDKVDWQEVQRRFEAGEQPTVIAGTGRPL
jgi:hypothetical protein